MLNYDTNNIYENLILTIVPVIFGEDPSPLEPYSMKINPRTEEMLLMYLSHEAMQFN